MQLFIWPEKGSFFLSPGMCSGGGGGGVLLVEMWEQQLFECWAWRSMGTGSSCWWSVSHTAGQWEWEKQWGKQPGQTNAEERAAGVKLQGRKGQTAERRTQRIKRWEIEVKGKHQLGNKRQLRTQWKIYILRSTPPHIVYIYFKKEFKTGK